jgi:hypothetical protein
MLFRLIMMFAMSCSVACYGTTSQMSVEHEKEVLQEVIVALEQEQASKAQQQTHRTALIATAVSLGVVTIACILYWLKKNQRLLAGPQQPASPISGGSISTDVFGNVPYPIEPPPPYFPTSSLGSSATSSSAPAFQPLGAFLD